MIFVGGQSQFGVLLQFTLRTYPTQGPAFAGPLVFPGAAFEAFVPVLEEYISKMEPQDHLIVEFSRAPPHFYVSIPNAPWAHALILSIARSCCSSVSARASFSC